jgi:ATP-dependent DNA ligase
MTVGSVYDPAVDALETTVWRPQAFGRRNARDIRDPIIEPMWHGDRVMVVVSGDTISVTDVDGAEIAEDVDAIIEELRAAVLADGVVLDGYLTRQATPLVGTVYLVGSELPTAGQMTSQMLVGRGLSARAMTKAEETPANVDKANPLAFVAVDLVLVDGQPLLEIPLLERKRLLESVVRESDLVRRGAYIRPPVDTWLASWRSLGFRELAYKSANGRYQPGAVNDTWAIARIPTT